MWGDIMKRLNIFVDETGEFGFGNGASELYGVSFTFHEQNNDIMLELNKLNDRLYNIGYTDMLHIADLIMKRGDYSKFPIAKRKSIFNSIYQFCRRIPVKYKTIIIDKKYTATASCTVTVKPPKNLQVSASLDSYNTRSNEFILSLKNYTGKTIRIYSNGSWVREDDYRFYDRNLKLSNGKSYIDIKPMKKATIKFKVKGRLTWYRVSDFTLFSKWKWNGKVYDTKVSYFGAYIKTGNKWKNMSVF